MPSTTELRKSYLNAAKNLSVTKPLYAWAGAGDLAVEKLRAVPDKVWKLRSEVTVGKLKAVPAKFKVEDAKKVTEVPAKLVDAVNVLPKTPKSISAKITDLTDGRVKAIDAKFDELAERGEAIVKRIRVRKPTIGRRTVAAKAPVAPARKTATKAAGAKTPAARKVGG